MQTQYLLHKHGGRITAIHSVAHETFQGVASWHFVGDVSWSDGGKSENTQIAPWAICADDSEPMAKQEVNAIMDKMNDYLRSNGEWLEKPKRKSGMLIHWMPKQKQAAISV